MKQLLILSGLLLLMTAVFAQNPQQVTVHPATAPATTKAKPASEKMASNATAPKTVKNGKHSKRHHRKAPATSTAKPKTGK